MFCSNEKCSPRSIILFLAISAAVLWLIWFGSASLLGKEDVESGFQKLSAQLTEIGSPYGRDIKVTHGDISFEGWGYHKRAVVSNVAIEVSGTLEPIKYTLATDSIVVSSDPINFHRIIMNLGAPIKLLQNESVVNTVTFSEPLVIAYEEMERDNVKASRSDAVFPKQITISKSQTASDLIQPGIVISFASAPTLQFISAPEHKSSSLTYSLSGLSVLDNGQNVVNIGSVTSDISKTSGDAEGRISGKNIFKASDIVAYINQIATKPYAVNLDADVMLDENPQASDKDESNNSENAYNSGVPDRNRDVVINDYTMSNPDFKLRMIGKFSNVKGDPLPVGQLNIDIDNLPKFLSSELVSNFSVSGLSAALAKITGEPVSGQTQVSIPIKREKGGTLYIGKTTFEELVASVFSGSIMPAIPYGERLPEVGAPPMSQPAPEPDNSTGEEGGDVELPSTKPE